MESLLFEGFNTPIYIVDESLLRRNLKLIQQVATDADVEIILAFKAFALWRTFPIFKEYINNTTASSVNECLLAYKEFGSMPHTYSPAYTDNDIDILAKYSSHLSFNSISQYQRYINKVKSINPDISCGIRINPEYSEVATDLYNPCSPGTRLGVTYDKLPSSLPSEIEGFHCHCHCESGSEELQHSLEQIEKHFSGWFSQIKWLNLGGGHLMTRKGYNIDLLISLMGTLHARYPWLKIYLEPGSAFAWQTGVLVSHVVDIVEDHGIRTAILDVSFTCHMPDCLEMPYQPSVMGAESLPDDAVKTSEQKDNIYRLGGNSCLAGDYIGSWKFERPLEIGDTVVFEDMIHYTTVKTTMFNGISHPAIAMLHEGGDIEILRQFTYEDYRDRMD